MMNDERKKPRRRGKRGDEVSSSLPMIAEQLRPLAVPIDELRIDPRNSRTHSQRNLDAIAASLTEFGQVKPLVAHKISKVIEAGNGTWSAAKSLGWSHLAVVWVEHDPAAARGFSIADNRTAELAGWDDAVLQDLLGGVAADQPDLYDALLLDELRTPEEEPQPDQADDSGDRQAPPCQVVVECRSPTDRKKFLDRMKKEGRKCHGFSW